MKVVFEHIIYVIRDYIYWETAGDALLRFFIFLLHLIMGYSQNFH